MSNLSDIKHIGDTFDTSAAAHDRDTPPVDTNPLLGLALVLASGVLTCGVAYFVLG